MVLTVARQDHAQEQEAAALCPLASWLAKELALACRSQAEAGFQRPERITLKKRDATEAEMDSYNRQSDVLKGTAADADT